MRAHMYLCLYVSLCVFEYVFASLLRKPPESEVAEVIRLLSLSHIFDCEEDSAVRNSRRAWIASEGK